MKKGQIREQILKIWKDPVLSKVIAAGIITGIALTWAKLTNNSWQEIYDFIIWILSYQFPVFVFLSVIGFYYIIKITIRSFKKKKDPLWDEQMGNYTFKELHDILLLETLPVRTLRMQMNGNAPPGDNLLELFRIYYIYLNEGVDFDNNIEDDSYLYSVLAPKLLGYGLVYSFDKPLRGAPGQKEIAYRTSEIGHRFYASIEKVLLPGKIKNYKRGKIKN